MADFLSWTPAEIASRLSELTPQEILDWDFKRHRETVNDDQLFSFEQVKEASDQPFPWPELPIFSDSDLIPNKPLTIITDKCPHNTVTAGSYIGSRVADVYPGLDIIEHFIVADNDEIKIAINWLREIVDNKSTLKGYMKKGLCVYMCAYKHHLILHRYQSVAAVLYEFDLGSSAVASDSTCEVKFTLLGLIAHAWHVNLIDPRRRGPNYEARLAKGLDRGFALGMVGFRGFQPGKTKITFPNFILTYERKSSVHALGKMFYSVFSEECEKMDKCDFEHVMARTVARMWDPEEPFVANLTMKTFGQLLESEIDLRALLERLMFDKKISNAEFDTTVKYLLNIPADQVEMLHKARKRAAKAHIKIDISAPLAPYFEAAQARFAEFDWKVPASYWWAKPPAALAESKPAVKYWDEVCAPPIAPSAHCAICSKEFLFGESWLQLSCGHAGHAFASEHCSGLDDVMTYTNCCPECPDQVKEFCLTADFFETGM